MTKKTKILTKVVDNKLEIKIEFDKFEQDLSGKKAKLELVSKVKVKDSRPVNSKKVLYKKNFKINDISHKELIDLSKLKIYTYKGKKIDIELVTNITVDDSMFFDTKISEKIQRELKSKPKVSNSAKNLVDPKDIFNFMDNIKAIPHKNKIITIGLSIVGLIVIGINTLIGIHDQFSPESQTYIYSHTNSDGESSSPLFNSLAGSGGIGVFIWILIKNQLRKYMTFILKRNKFLKSREGIYNISEIVGGKSRVDLKDIRVRIISANMEKGQYVRGSGSNRRTVSFSEPVRGSILYDQQIDLIPKNTEVSEYIKGTFSFEKMYKALYPSLIISDSHGLFVHWEIQLIHGKFIDQEIIGPSNSFKYENFLQA